MQPNLDGFLKDEVVKPEAFFFEYFLLRRKAGDQGFDSRNQVGVWK